MNYKAQLLSQELFMTTEKSRVDKPSSSRGPVIQESWMCGVCEEDFVADMRACRSCGTWIHEECVGLTKDDTDEFVCGECR